MTTSVFSPDVARALEGPEWLTQRRVAAAERFAAAALPTTEEEVWRYSRIGQLDLDRYRPATMNGQAPSIALPDIDRAALVVVVNGTVVRHELDPELDAAGVFAGRLVDHPDAAALLGSVLTEPPDVFAELNDGFVLDPVAIVIPPHVRVERPIVVVHYINRSASAVFPRLVVHAGDDSEVRVLEHQSSGVEPALVASVVELRAGRAARLGYCNVQQLGARTWQIASQVACVDADATLDASTAGLGGDYTRVRTDCRLVGRGATGNLSSLYFGDGEQMLDFRTFQDHAAPDTTSTLLFKGAVADHSRSVYTGLIRVHKNARGTNAFQTNRNIRLSDDAWAESVPNLQIENNDVRCSHASTIGPIDDDQRFYLESRGVPPESAARLIVSGFFTEVFDALAVSDAVPALRAAIETKLDRREEP